MTTDKLDQLRQKTWELNWVGIPGEEGKVRENWHICIEEAM